MVDLDDAPDRRRARDLTMFNLAIDSKLRGSNLGAWTAALRHKWPFHIDRGRKYFGFAAAWSEGLVWLRPWRALLSQRQEQQMMEHPTEDDFTVVEVFESSVTVLFEPTRSFYTFYRLVDPNDIKRFGPVSPEPDNIRHAGPSGDIGDYRSDEVQGMAHSFASDATRAK
jgi:hypothetical protein